MTIRLATGPPAVLTADPAEAQRLLTLPSDVATGAEENAALEPLLGPRSVLMRDGPDHVRLRHLLAPLLRGERMRRQAGAIAELTRREVASWPRGRPFPLPPRMRAITLEVIVRVVFGLARSPRVDELCALLERLLGAGSTWMVIAALRREFPGSPWSRFLRLKREVDEALRAELAAAPAHGDGDDAASLLRRAAEAGELTQADVVDQLVTLLVAGHETTATSLAWGFDLLLHEPAAQRRRLVGDDALLEGAVRETLRLRPIFRMTSRRLHRASQLAGWDLPAGTTVGANILALHRRPDVYPDPDTFRPERWPARGGDGPPPGAFLPFGAGLRRCLGAAFAPFEMGIVIRTVLDTVRLRPASPQPEPMAMHAVTMVPRHGARVVVEG